MQLKKFWSAHKVEWKTPMQEGTAESSARLRAASFVPGGSRILDVASGLATNSDFSGDSENIFRSGCFAEFFALARRGAAFAAGLFGWRGAAVCGGIF